MQIPFLFNNRKYSLQVLEQLLGHFLEYSFSYLWLNKYEGILFKFKIGIGFIGKEPEADQGQYQALYLMTSLNAWKTSGFLHLNCFVGGGVEKFSFYSLGSLADLTIKLT